MGSMPSIQRQQRSLGNVEENYKRWIIIGIVMDTVMAHALRGYVQTKMDQLYQTLNNSNNIGSQQYPNQMPSHSGTFLNYETINNNKSQQQKSFDYNVRNSVDLSKLFLETSMARYAAIDESCDLSDLLEIVIKSGICLGNAQQSSKKFRDEVRNLWAHCAYSEWNETKYTDSFNLMEQLIKDVEFSVQKEEYLIADLNKWKNKGEAFIKTESTEVLKDVKHHISALVNSCKVKEVDPPEKLLKLKEKLVKADNLFLYHSRRIHLLEQIVREIAYPRMDEDSRKLYKKVLESGFEIKREIRVIVVGRKGAGKTCLTRRLRSQPIHDVRDTNGIEIHSIICKDDNITDDNTWHEKTQSADSRLLTCTKLTEKETQMGPRIGSDNGNEVIYERLRQTDEKQEALIPSGTERTEESMNLDKKSAAKGQSPVSTDTDKDINIDQDIKDMTNAMENDENDIRIHVWDFGGDEEFYHTHQLFLAENVVFLIVTSLENSDVSSDKEFRFWFDTIHCLCTDPESPTLKPRCIVVGTKTDLCENEEAADDIFSKKLQSVPGTLRNHIYGQGFLISNKETYDQAIKDIKTAIISAAKENTVWESKHPVRFILLDKSLDKKRRELEKRPVITRSDIQSINEGLHQPLTKDELELYLRYNHLAGHLIYYEDIPDYIIIVPQWLSELFRCIVTADKFRPSQLPKHDLKTLRSTGQLTGNLLRDIFHVKDVEAELQSYLMQVLEKFQIVIEVSHSNEDRTKKYFAPCMVSDKIFDATIFARTVREKSTWLCLECDFLPPFLFNQIVIFFCDKYLSAIGQNVYPEFYSDGAVIEISPNRCEKLVILRLTNVIQLQIIMFGQREPQQCREVKSLLTQKITELTQTYSLTIKYEYKWKCPESSHNCSRLLELNACSEGEDYYCDTWTDEGIHIFHNYWDENLQQSTLSKEELNFTRLAMLVTEVLADALHDLLPLPKSIARNQCDVTSLYQKHRNLNTHTPSSGRWGGVQTVNDIPANSILVGDDIERCRVIRNRLNHSPHYRIPDNEINDVYLIIHEVLTRLYAFMGLGSTPTYMDRAEEIKRKTYAVADKEVIKEKLNRETSIHNYNAEKIEVHHHHHYK